MLLDKTLALFFLFVCMIYGYTAYNYPLLPFEKNMVFLPNTMPQALSVLGILLSSFILFTSKKVKVLEKSDEIEFSKIEYYKIFQALMLLICMILYALSIRPIGFIIATVLFIVTSSWILGERKLIKMISIAFIVTVFIWYLVQEVLGIFLKPLPNFI